MLASYTALADNQGRAAPYLERSGKGWGEGARCARGVSGRKPDYHCQRQRVWLSATGEADEANAARRRQAGAERTECEPRAPLDDHTDTSNLPTCGIVVVEGRGRW